jgi:hypothetical protein
MEPNLYDPDIGSLWKPGIWATYITFNYIGSYLCVLLEISIAHHTQRTTGDIFLSGLLSGCIWMSMTCGSQCLINVIHNTFFGGPIACWLEALFHVTGILVQFFCVTYLSLRHYGVIVHRYDLTQKQAISTVLLTWFLCLIITFSLGYASEIYLVSNGTYCFYQFKSPAILGWLVPGLFISLVGMIFAYVQIWRYTRQVFERSEALGASTAPATRLAKKAALFVLVLLLGWIIAAITAVYEYIQGEAPEGMVTALGVMGTAHTVAVAIVYASTNQIHAENLKRLLCCKCPQPETHSLIQITVRGSPNAYRTTT